MQLVVLQDEQVIRKVRRQRQRRKPTLAERKRYYAHRHVLQWLDEKQTPFRIDAESALVAAAHERTRVEADPSLRRQKGPGWKRRWGRHQDVEHFVSPNEQHTQRINTIVRLADREFGPILDEVGGRLHSSLTNMSSLLRPFVYAEGHGQLVSLDLANSQPYLLNLLVNPAFYREDFRSSNFRRGGLRWEVEGKGIRKEVREGYRKEGEDADLMLANVLEGADRQELDKLAAWTSGGTFYQHLRKALAELNDPDLADAPGDVKELIFLVLFSKNRYSTPGKRAFAKLFPTVDKVLRLLKRWDHSALPRLLQTLEAHVFLQAIGGHIARVLPDVPFATVHDCIVVPAPYADQVEHIMREELEAHVGLRPHIKRELWGQQVREQSLCNVASINLQELA